MWRLTELFVGHGAMAAERLGLIALENLETIAARSRRVLDANRDALNAFYRTRADLEWTEHRFGTVSFPRLRAGTAAPLCRLLEAKHDTAVVDGAFFEMPEHFRIALGAEPEVFAEGLRRLGLALDAMRQG
jgi:aspartate/methionine/tyrosine aminotransferase